MGTQLLVFPLGPQDQVSIQFAHGWVERRTIVAPVILEPTPDDRIEHPRQVFDGLITALWQFPASKCVADCLRCLVRDRRTEKLACCSIPRTEHRIFTATWRTVGLLHASPRWDWMRKEWAGTLSSVSVRPRFVEPAVWKTSTTSGW